MSVEMRHIHGHVEVFDQFGEFLFSADTVGEDDEIVVLDLGGRFSGGNELGQIFESHAYILA